MKNFGNFGKQRNLDILDIESLSDERLVMIDPTKKGFYDNVINYSTKNTQIQSFIEAICHVKAKGIKPFYRPRMDPSIDGGKVVYKKGSIPATGPSYLWWVMASKTMPTVEGKKWKLGSKDHYQAFMVFLINGLIDTGWSIRAAMEAIVLDSMKLGNFALAKNVVRAVCEPTGSREILGICDLGNTFKILSSFDAMTNGFWIAGGAYFYTSKFSPVSQIHREFFINKKLFGCVGWLILD